MEWQKGQGQTLTGVESGQPVLAHLRRPTEAPGEDHHSHPPFLSKEQTEEGLQQQRGRTLLGHPPPLLMHPRQAALGDERTCLRPEEMEEWRP